MDLPSTGALALSPSGVNIKRMVSTPRKRSKVADSAAGMAIDLSSSKPPHSSRDLIEVEQRGTNGQH